MQAEARRVPFYPPWGKTPAGEILQLHEFFACAVIAGDAPTDEERAAVRRQLEVYVLRYQTRPIVSEREDLVYDAVQLRRVYTLIAGAYGPPFDPVPEQLRDS
jgi:hypothetical protein